MGRNHVQEEDYNREEEEGREQQPETGVRQGGTSVVREEKAEGVPADEGECYCQALSADGLERRDIERVDAH